MRQAEQDLAMIRRIVEESRRDVVDRGKHFLIWGPLSAIGLIATHLSVVGATRLNPTWAWLAVLAVGWATSLVVGWRDGRRARVVTLGRRMLSGIWIAAGVTLTLLGLVGMFGGAYDHHALPGLLSAVVAAPVLLTALLIRERWLGAVAVGWWLGAAVMLVAPGLYTLLVMAVMSLLLMAVPGAVLYVRSQRSAGPAVDALTDAG
jgi:hypothetical protein